MSNAFAIAETGMKAFQLHVDTIANNVANSKTPGFKALRVDFRELMQEPASAAMRAVAGVNGRHAVADFAAGALVPSTSQFDVAIDGAGFISALAADGGRVFSRGGSLKVSDGGVLMLADGAELDPRIIVPANASEIRIDAHGQVAVRSANGWRDAGRIALAQFANPEGLQAIGNGLYAASEASGNAMTVVAGSDGIGRIAQYRSEDSNVDLTSQLVALMAAQRAFSLNAKVLQAADGLMGAANELMK